MKKVFAGILAATVMMSVCAVAADAPAAAQPAQPKGGVGPAIFSFLLPGCGEWMNNEFKGNFPIGECIVGSICFPFMISSVVDAAAGRGDTDTRFDFWTSPNKGK